MVVVEDKVDVIEEGGGCGRRKVGVIGEEDA